MTYHERDQVSNRHIAQLQYEYYSVLLHRTMSNEECMYLAIHTLPRLCEQRELASEICEYQFSHYFIMVRIRNAGWLLSTASFPHI